MKQITIYDLLPLFKSGYVAMDSRGGWTWFGKYPSPAKYGIWTTTMPPKAYSLKCFNIAPFDGSWKDSLIKVEHKEEE